MLPDCGTARRSTTQERRAVGIPQPRPCRVPAVFAGVDGRGGTAPPLPACVGYTSGRATKRDKPLPAPRPLTPEQLNALDLLAGSATDAAVGTAVGVHRVTVTKWRTSPTFLAALNRRRADLFASATDTLRDLIPKALAVIGEALAEAEISGVEVVRGSGDCRPTQRGSPGGATLSREDQWP